MEPNKGTTSVMELGRRGGRALVPAASVTRPTFRPLRDACSVTGYVAKSGRVSVLRSRHLTGRSRNTEISVGRPLTLDQLRGTVRTAVGFHPKLARFATWMRASPPGRVELARSGPGVTANVAAGCRAVEKPARVCYGHVDARSSKVSQPPCTCPSSALSGDRPSRPRGRRPQAFPRRVRSLRASQARRG